MSKGGSSKRSGRACAKCRASRRCSVTTRFVPTTNSGKVLKLSTQHSKFAPDLPTFAEQKVPGLDGRDWFGVYIAGTPSAEVVARVAPLVRAATASPAYVSALAVASLDAASCTPQELERLARADFDRWAPIVKASGFVADF